MNHFFLFGFQVMDVMNVRLNDDGSRSTTSRTNPERDDLRWIVGYQPEFMIRGPSYKRADAVIPKVGFETEVRVGFAVSMLPLS